MIRPRCSPSVHSAADRGAVGTSHRKFLLACWLPEVGNPHTPPLTRQSQQKCTKQIWTGTSLFHGHGSHSQVNWSQMNQLGICSLSLVPLSPAYLRDFVPDFWSSNLEHGLSCGRITHLAMQKRLQSIWCMESGWSCGSKTGRAVE